MPFQEQDAFGMAFFYAKKYKEVPSYGKTTEKGQGPSENCLLVAGRDGVCHAHFPAVIYSHRTVILG